MAYITSVSDSNDSLISVVYADSRTGKCVRYVTNGGGTSTAVIKAVNENQFVKFRHLHGADTQLYNMYGHMTSVVPLLNDNHAFQGVAMVAIKNVQTSVGVGADALEAQREYEKVLSESGQKVAPDRSRVIDIVQGVVDRFGTEQGRSGGTTYYLHVASVPHIFSAGTGKRRR